MTKHLAYNIPFFFSPGYLKTVDAEGMPLSKSPNQRGNLIITFNIEFPKHLSTEQKTLLSQALSV